MKFLLGYKMYIETAVIAKKNKTLCDTALSRIKFGSPKFIHRYCSALRSSMNEEIATKFVDKLSFNGSNNIRNLKFD